MESANLIADNGKTSMYQDIISKRKTEVDIFSGEIVSIFTKEERKLQRMKLMKELINENREKRTNKILRYR